VTKKLDKYFTDDERATFTEDDNLAATGKRLDTDLAAVDASIANNENPDSNMKERLKNLIAGNLSTRPQTLAERRTEIQYARRDVEYARDDLAPKKRSAIHEAGKRFVATEIKQQHDIAEREEAEALLVFYEKFLRCWRLKRSLLNDGIGLYGLFNSTSDIEETLGVPVDKTTPWNSLLRDAVEKKYIKNMPKELK
jgi:hypothetical protein